MFDRGVFPGMRVVDSTGAEIGTVESVKMGDPEAVTTQGQQTGDSPDLVTRLAESVAGEEPDVPPAAAARLTRLGYLKVDTKGLFSTDRYVASDEIADVSEDTVRLTVPLDRLVRED